MKIIPTNIDTELLLSKDECDMLKNVSSLKNIVIQKSVKGNSAVLRNHDDYAK